MPVQYQPVGYRQVVRSEATYFPFLFILFIIAGPINTSLLEYILLEVGPAYKKNKRKGTQSSTASQTILWFIQASVSFLLCGLDQRMVELCVCLSFILILSFSERPHVMEWNCAV